MSRIAEGVHMLSLSSRPFLAGASFPALASIIPHVHKKSKAFLQIAAALPNQISEQEAPARAKATLFQQGVFSNPLHFPCRYGRMGRKNGCNREEARL
jgi:hypothetical protein